MAQVHILIVEDSESLTNALRVFFKEHGYRVSTAATVAAATERAGMGVGGSKIQSRGENAAESASALAPVDIMLLDLTLPDGEGLAVLANLRDMGRTPPRVTIALTGYEDNATRDRCLAAGCQKVLTKPIPLRRWLATVQAVAADLH